ncbi:MAG: cytochrome b5-like heme/steroid binding domain-containing protein [Candidatus Buchananbacteria bacterium]
MKKIFLLLGLVLILTGCTPVAKPGTPATAGNSQTIYTFEQVRVASSSSKCWTIIQGKVYDLTGFINQHPGGSEMIVKLCGQDGTTAFMAKHGGQTNAEQALVNLQIGVFK